MTPQELMQLQMMRPGGAQMGAIGQAQGMPAMPAAAPAAPVGMPGTPNMPEVQDKAALIKAIEAKVSALPPATQAKFKEALIQQMRQAAGQR